MTYTTLKAFLFFYIYGRRIFIFKVDNMKIGRTTKTHATSTFLADAFIVNIINKVLK
jgi:hypothetical protein